MRVVIDLEQIITAFPQTNDPVWAMTDRTITIGETTFDHVDYDRDADVLYLSIGEPRPAAQTYGTPEGHAVRYDPDGRIIGITLVNANLLLDRGDIHVTVPQVVDVQRDELKLAIAS